MIKKHFLSLLVLSVLSPIFADNNFITNEKTLYLYQRPKPNIMLTLDTSKEGWDSKIILSPEEQLFFKDYLNGKSILTKTEAITVIYSKLMDEYTPYAHFGLAKVGDMSPFSYYSNDSTYFGTDEKEMSTIIIPIYEYDSIEKAKKYVGRYDVISQEEMAHNDIIKKTLKEFPSKYKSDNNRRAWLYGLSELIKYYWGNGYSKDTRAFPARNGGLVDKVLAENKESGIEGEKRIQYKQYPNPTKYVCQDFRVLYTPVTTSSDYAENSYDTVTNIPFSYTYTIWNSSGNSGSVYYRSDANTTSFYDKNYYVDRNLTYSQQYEKTSDQLQNATNYKKGNYTDAIENAIVNYNYGGYQPLSFSLGALLSNNGKLDFGGNTWKNFDYDYNLGYSSGGYSGTAKLDGVYEPSRIAIGVSLFDQLTDPKSLYTSSWNNISKSVWDMFLQKQPVKTEDKLHAFVNDLDASLDKASAINFKQWNQTVSGSSQYGESYGHPVKSFYQIPNLEFNEPSMSELYESYRFSLDKTLIPYKNRGRIFSDQHNDDLTDGGMTVFTIESNEALSGSIIYANSSIALQKNKLYSYIIGYRSGGDRTATFRPESESPIWSTNDTIQYNQGEFFSSSSGTKTALPGSDAQKRWLKGDLTLPKDEFRHRNSRLGTIMHSQIRYVAKDRMHINLAKVGDREKYAEYMFIKNDNLHQNLIIAGSNDGFLNFIVAQRNSKGQAGQRKASYFIPFFKEDINRITAPLYKRDSNNDLRLNFQDKIRVDGNINVFDGFVENNTFKTLGITGMGGGAKGLVGFQLFEATSPSQTNSEILPLYEISNDTPGFENLGYTYSEFAYLNTDDNKAIAVFGNGPGNKSNISSLYFINANTGEKIGEIDLSLYGGQGGAFPPTLILDKGSSGQKIKRIYVGDYFGNLFKIELSNVSLSGINNAKVTRIFQTIDNQPITTHPYVAQNPTTRKYWVLFGTGMLATNYDKTTRGEQYFYSIEDRDDNSLVDVSMLRNVDTSYYYRKDTATNSRYFVGYSKGREIYLSNTDALAEDERGWYIPLQAPSLNGKTMNLYNNKMSSSMMINPPVTISKNQVMFATETIIPGDEDNLCASDLTMTNVFVIDPFEIDVKEGIKSSSYIRLTTPSKTLGAFKQISKFNTFSVINADNQLGNIDSGINMKLKPSEREKLDDLSNPIVQDACGEAKENLKEIKEKYGITYSYSNQLTCAAFSQSSNIGGRHLPAFSDSKNTQGAWSISRQGPINYTYYNTHLFSIGGLQYDNYAIYLPTSSALGIGSAFYSSEIVSSTFDEEPKKIKSQRIQLQRIF